MASTRPLKIFLSYAFDDNSRVEKIRDWLSAAGAKPWLDTEDLLPGQDWKMEIGKVLDETDVILLCLSKMSVSKEGYVQKEMRLALDRALEMPEGRIFLIPARLEECEMPFRLKDLQRVDLFADGGMDRLMKSLNACAKQVGVRPLSSDEAPEIEKASAPKKPKTKPPSGPVVNIHGNMTGNIVIGDDNKVNSD